MSFWNTENKIEPKQNFYSEIKQYFIGLADNRIPTDLLEEIILIVTDQIYNDYSRFWKQYPKSRKRYSKLKLEDIEHPFIRYRITDFLKAKVRSEYRSYSKILFQMNDDEFDDFEKQKEWYETK